MSTLMEWWNWAWDYSSWCPRTACGDWPEWLIRMHRWSDEAIWWAYVAIPLVILLFLARKRRRLPYPIIGICFAAFIFSCGYGHRIESLMFDTPIYRLSGMIKLFTAVASWATVIALFCVMPKAMNLKTVKECEEESKLEIERRTRQLEEANRVAEEASQAKTQFLAILSHEMRTPLTPCLLMATSFSMDPETPERCRKAFGDIQRLLELEARLIDDLLDVMLIIRGKMSFRMTVLDAHHKIRLATDICRADLIDKQIELKLKFEAGQRHITADSARLQQVIWNLIKNAVKYTPKGGEIVVHTYNVGEMIRIEVSDNGIGMNAEVIPTVFDAFIQGERNKGRKYGGLGLGLAISKAIIDGHKGNIRAFSAGEGKGSKFVVELQTTHIPETDPPDYHEPTAQGEAEKYRVLYVEDDKATQRVMVQLLERSGYRVTMVGSLREGMAIDPTHYDVLVSDIGLSDGTGFELMSYYRSKGYDTPGISLSGYGADEDVAQSAQVGFAEHLTKPISFQNLEIAIKRVAKSRR